MWPSLLAILAVVLILSYQLYFLILREQIGTTLTDQRRIYIIIGLVAIQFLRVFLSKNPVIKLNAATVLYTYNTAFFSKLLRKKQIVSFGASAVLSLLTALLLCGFKVTSGTIHTFFISLLYIHCCTLTAWILFHEWKKRFLAALLLFVGITTLLAFHSTVSAIALALVLIVLEIYISRVMVLNIPKYYERLRLIDETTAASSHFDLAKMQQLANENRSANVHSYNLNHISKRTALIAKGIIEIVRLQKQIWVVQILFLAAGYIISKTELLTFLPLLDNTAMRNVLGAYCITIALHALYEVLSKQVKTVCDKRLLGLSLPYTTKEIFISYALIAIFLNLIITICIAILYVRYFQHYSFTG